MTIYIQLQCDFCSKTFNRRPSDIAQHKKRGRIGKFCSYQCSLKDRKNKSKNIECVCKNCQIKFKKHLSAIIRTKNNNFCSKSCAVTYNNTHKTTGYRRSKLEIYIEQQLTQLYPDLNILFNNKTTINSELDIYIPSLNLAFELNGIFHYEPIYGEEKLSQIQNNDQRKFQACLEKQIELCIIDISKQKYFKEKTSKKYLDIICNIINMKWNQKESNFQ